MDITYLIEYINSNELKEWRSKKELEEYLMQEKRNEVIGYVTHKTLEKWDENIDWRGWRNQENMYVLQKEHKYYYLTFRTVNTYWR